jgi:oligopeptidase B (EC:3.4.21.83). Serine peptidase. MEROPS family S09A
MSQQQPPEAKKVPHTWSIHGDQRVDNYHWLRDDKRSDADVLAYLTAENTYTEAQLKDVEPLVDTLYQEITSRIKQNDESVPYLLGDYWYYKRYSEGQEYPIYARKKDF